MTLSSEQETRTGPQPTHKAAVPPVVWLLGAVAFIMGTTEMVVAGLLPQTAAATHVTLGQAGLLITAFAVGMMVGAPAMALATLRLPRKATLVAALVVFAVAHVVCASTSDFAVLLVARFAAAVATGTFWAIGAVVAAAAAGPAAGARVMGIMVGGVTLANIIGVPVGTAAGQVMGWQGPFWALAVLAAAAAVVLALRLPTDRGERGVGLVRQEFRRLRNGRLWVIYVAIGLYQAAFVAVYSYVAPLLTERAGLPEVVVPLVMLGYGVGALAGTTVAGRFGDRRPFLLLIPGTILLALTIVAMLLWGGSAPVAITLFVLLGFFGLLGNPVLIAQTVKVAGTEGALPMALTTSWFNVGIAAGSWAGGIALVSPLSVSGPPIVGLVVAVAALVPICALALLPRRRTAR